MLGGIINCLSKLKSPPYSLKDIPTYNIPWSAHVIDSLINMVSLPSIDTWNLKKESLNDLEKDQSCVLLGIFQNTEDIIPYLILIIQFKTNPVCLFNCWPLLAFLSGRFPIPSGKISPGTTSSSKNVTLQIHQAE